MRSQVLFVDDEPLMRELYSMVGAALGDNFQITTLPTAKDALDFLQSSSVDVIVSDLAMPGMSGHELMTTVCREHPEAMRILISAHDDQLTVAQSLMVGHRYFNKPFDVRNLAAVLKRICHLKHQVGSGKLKRVISGLGALPTPPAIYQKLSRAVNSPYSTIEEIGAIVQEDPGLTLKLLQISNSAYFGTSRKIVTPGEAVQIVGLEILRALVLCIHAFKFFQDKKLKSLSVTELWDHSIRTASAARKLARYENLPAELCEETFVTGLLHDIGKLVLAANADSEYSEIMERSRREGTPVDQIEWESFGSTHAQIGAYLLGLWGLPETIVSNVELHHSLELNPQPGFTPAAAIHVAQFLERSPNRISQLDTRFLKQIGVENRISEWERVLQE